MYCSSKENEEVDKNVLVKGKETRDVDANHPFSLLCPDYSDDGTSRRMLKETIMDNFQYLFIALGVNHIS